jgi:hypothetical protein
MPLAKSSHVQAHDWPLAGPQCLPPLPPHSQGSGRKAVAANGYRTADQRSASGSNTGRRIYQQQGITAKHSLTELSVTPIVVLTVSQQSVGLAYVRAAWHCIWAPLHCTHHLPSHHAPSWLQQQATWEDGHPPPPHIHAHELICTYRPASLMLCTANTVPIKGSQATTSMVPTSRHTLALPRCSRQFVLLHTAAALRQSCFWHGLQAQQLMLPHPFTSSHTEAPSNTCTQHNCSFHSLRHMHLHTQCYPCTPRHCKHDTHTH